MSETHRYEKARSSASQAMRSVFVSNSSAAVAIILLAVIAVLTPPVWQLVPVVFLAIASLMVVARLRRVTDALGAMIAASDVMVDLLGKANVVMSESRDALIKMKSLEDARDGDVPPSQ